MTSLFDDPAATAGPPRTGGGDAAEALLADLNEPQRRAVTHRGSPLLVVAGAGSGKTRVLTRRIAHLIATGAAGPGQIVAITFTNKAAAEMKERVAAAIGPRARAMWVSTFHSLGVRILRAQAQFLPVKSGFTIYDAADSLRLVTMVANRMDLDTKKNTPRMLAAAVSNLKNDLLGPAEAVERAGTDYEKLVAAVYEDYQARLRAADAVDFDDLILETVTLLRSRPAVKEYYRRRFTHVLVDEYQDTNHAQYQLVRELVHGGVDGLPPAELAVVGDADQSIYAFRGASIRNIVEFEQDYPDATTVLLEQNYRSTQTILSAANAMIARNKGRRRKNLWTAAGPGARIVGYVGDDEYEEAQFIVDEIDRLRDDGEATYGDVAVFYRTNAASRAIEDVLVRSGIPYRIVGGVRFYERKEVKDALAYLRVVANRADEVSLRRILNTPKRGIGDRAEATIAAWAEQEQVPFAAALSGYADIPYLATRSAKAVGAFVALLDGLDEVADAGGDPADVLVAMLERTGYREQLESSDDPQDASRLENLEQLVTVLREIADRVAAAAAVEAEVETGVEAGAEAGSEAAIEAGVETGAEAGQAERPDAAEEAEGAPGGRDVIAAPLSSRELLTAVLEQLSLVADADAVPDSEEGLVTLMTLHTAKGLEFDVVFFTGWEDGMFPHQRSWGSETELAEERRLGYVGVTRARRRLYVTRAVGRSTWGQQIANPASRFLGDIPDDLVEWRRLPEERPGGGADYPDEWAAYAASRRSASGYGSGGYGSGGYGSSGRSGGYGGRGPGRSAPVSASRFGGSAAQRAPLRLAVGDRVTHDKYGLGTVKEVSGTGATATATIDFGTSGTVRLMLIGGVPMAKL